MSEEKNEIGPLDDLVEELPVTEEITIIPIVEETIVEEPKAVKEETAEKPKADKKIKTTRNTVALRAKRNVSWQGVGTLTKGINIVSAEDAEKWVTIYGVTIATPEEVAKEFDL